jgi:2-phospho-L-lactate guanylyltransferase
MPTHVVLLPVKPPAYGKSRLTAVPDAVRHELAEAFALDTAAACLAAPAVGAVLAVTDDAFFAAALGDLGCAAIPDGVVGDLNATLAQAAAEATRRWPLWQPAAMCGDLPALHVDDLETALSEAVRGPAFVADADGTGTTLYTAPAADFSPRFGPDSARLHGISGAVPVSGDLASLRRDVDTFADLEAALALGVGPRTAAVLEKHGGPAHWGRPSN